jgi:hypothetical protein
MNTYFPSANIITTLFWLALRQDTLPYVPTYWSDIIAITPLYRYAYHFAHIIYTLVYYYIISPSGSTLRWYCLLHIILLLAQSQPLYIYATFFDAVSGRSVSLLLYRR